MWRLPTGAPWREIPERYGPWSTCHERFVRWRRDGTWDRLLGQVQTKSDAVGEIDWDISINATIVRAHQHAAGARKAAGTRGPGPPRPAGQRPAGQTGRLRGARAQPGWAVD